MLDKLEYWHEEYATCPFCGHKDMDSWELDDKDELDCDCGGTYSVERSIEVSYSSKPITDNKQIQPA